MLLFENTLQIKNANYLANLNEDKLLLFVEDYKDTKSIPSIIKFLKRIKATLPSKGTESSYPDFDINILVPNPRKFLMTKDDKEVKIKKNAPISSNIFFEGGSKRLIKQAHTNCDSIINGLQELEKIYENELKNIKTVHSESMDIEIISKNSLSKMYRFLSEYFIIKCKEDEFTDLHNTNIILIRPRDNRLSIKRITKSMVGVLFGFIIEENDYLYSRLLFEHTRSKDTVKVDYEDALRVLKNSRLKDRNESLNIFEKNLSNAYKSFLD